MDYFQQEIESKGAPATKDYFSEEIPRTPADSSTEMKDAQYWQQHPYMKAMKDTGEQVLVNPIVKPLNTLSPALNGIAKGIGMPQTQNVQELKGPDMANAPFAAKVLGDVAGGVTKGVEATVAGAGNPIAGFGALSGLEAYGRNEDVLPAALEGVKSGVLMGAAGKVGSSLASAAAKPIGGMIAKAAPRVGTAAGMAGINAIMAPEGEKTKDATTGAVFGMLSPTNPIGAKKQVTQAQHDQIVEKEAANMRNVLNPDKADIRKLEIKSNKDIDDYMKLAVKKGLVIGKSADGTKMDTEISRAQLEDHNKPLYDQMNDILDSNPNKQFNLDKIGKSVKSSLSKTIKSASDLKAAHAKVDNEIDAEILRHGPDVDGKTLNMIKQGLWSKSYNPMEPNSNDTARAIGFSAKDAIEKAYPNDDIKSLNKQIGDNLTLKSLLEKAHGRVIQAGKIGKYAAQGVGALTGHATHIPGGEIAGSWLAGKISAGINDPTRITQGIAKRMGNLEITNPLPITSKRPGVVTPQVMNPPPSPKGSGPTNSLPPSKSIIPGSISNTNLNPVLGIPNKASWYEPSGFTPADDTYIKERQNIPQEPLITPKGGIPYTPGPQAVIHPRPDEAGFNPAGNPGINQGDNPILNEFNPLKNAQDGSTTDMPNSVKALGLAGALGLGSVLNPSSSQAQNIKEPERLELPGPQYTMKEEGWQGMPYLDTKGIKTVGYGFSMNGPAAKYIPQAVKDGKRALTKEEGQNIFNQVYPQAMMRAQKFAGINWALLSDNQRKALVDMSYNLKPGALEGFKKLKNAIEGGHFNTAAREILNSKYAKEDVPNRAKRNSILIQGS